MILAAAVGVGLGVTGMPIYTTGQFIRPLGAEFGWSRAAVTGGLTFLAVGNALMAPLIGALIERFGVRRVAMTAMVGMSAGYFALTLNGGSLAAYYAAWSLLAVLGSGTSPNVWTRAVASWFERARGLALGITLCGTGVVAVVGPGLIGDVIARHGWRSGCYAISAAQLLVGLPVAFLLLRARVRPAADADAGRPALTGATLGEAAASVQFRRLIGSFFLLPVAIGGLIVNLPALLSDTGINQAQASRALALLGFTVIAGRLTTGLLVDRFPARFVAPAYILLAAVSCLLLAQGRGVTAAILLIGLSAGAEVDLLAYLTSRYFGLLHYSKIYGWALAAFGVGAGIGPVLGGWVHDRTGSYQDALYAYAAVATVGAGLIASLGPPDPAALRRPVRP